MEVFICHADIVRIIETHSLERRGGEGEKDILPYTCLLGDICMQEEEQCL